MVLIGISDPSYLGSSLLGFPLTSTALFTCRLFIVKYLKCIMLNQTYADLDAKQWSTAADINALRVLVCRVPAIVSKPQPPGFQEYSSGASVMEREH